MSVCEKQHVELDSFIIAHILSNFARSIPSSKPLIIDHTLLAQLIDKATTVFIKQPDILDAIGCLYSICLYCATCPRFENDHLTISCAILLQTVASDCLNTMQTEVRLDSMVVMGNPVDILFSDEGLYDHSLKLREYLSDGFELSKEIIRDVTRHIRTAHDKGSMKKEYPKDAFSAHSIYFLCNFGLAHIAGMLKLNNNINSLPGLLDSLLLMSLTTVRKKIRQYDDMLKLSTSDSRFIQLNHFYDDSRLEKCISLSAKLGREAILFGVDERVAWCWFAISSNTENFSQTGIQFLCLHTAG